MKAFVAGINTSVVSSYDKTKTTIAGRIFQKTLNSQTVLGAPLTSFLDVMTIVGTPPILSFFNPNTNRLYVVCVATGATASPVVALFNLNSSTGVYSYVGNIILHVANSATTVHTFRGLKVDDSNAANIKIFLASTGSIAVNGGTYMAYGIVAADFTIAGTNIWSAQSSGAKAVYFLQDPASTGVANLVANSPWGLAAPFASTNAAYNTKVLQMNGTIAVSTIYAWDYSGTPAVANTTASVSSSLTAYASTSPVAYFTSGSVNPNVTTSDPVVLTGAAPTNFTASTGTAAQTVYFARDVQLISGSYYFNLATTAAGAAVVPTSAVAGTITLMRAFGTSTNLFSLKTGTLAPALTGTILQANSFGYCNPTNVPSNTSLNGLDCLYVATQTNLYLFKLTDVTAGSTFWTVAPGATALGSGSDITVPNVAFAIYSTEMDRWVYNTNVSTFVIKPSQSNMISQVFGGLSDQYLEGQNPVSVAASMAAVAGMDVKGGWLFMMGSTVGQRGIIIVDMRSDDAYNYSYLVSPVLNSPVGSVLRYLQTLEQYFDYTDSVRMQVRSAATSSDPIFNSVTGSWVDVPDAKDYNTAIQAYFQFRLSFYVNTFFANSPAQIADIQYSLQMLFESSDNWALDNDNTTVGTNTPSYVSGVLAQVYASGTVPQLFYRAFDANGNQLFQYDTVTNASSFGYSTNGGTSWTALGTVPNVLGTRLRLLVASPPSQLAYVTIRES